MKQYEQKQIIKNWYFKKHHQSPWDAFQDLNKLDQELFFRPHFEPVTTACFLLCY